MDTRVVVYLAGGFHTDWAKEVMRRSPRESFLFLNPKDGWIGTVHETEIEKEEKSKASGYPTYWDVDTLAVKRADLLFAFLDDYRPKLLGPGTIFELGMARAWNKPAIVVNEVDHRYYRELCKLFDVVKTLDEGIEKLLSYAWLRGACYDGEFG